MKKQVTNLIITALIVGLVVGVGVYFYQEGRISQKEDELVEFQDKVDAKENKIDELEKKVKDLQQTINQSEKEAPESKELLENMKKELDFKLTQPQSGQFNWTTSTQHGEMVQVDGFTVNAENVSENTEEKLEYFEEMKKYLKEQGLQTSDFNVATGMGTQVWGGKKSNLVCIVQSGPLAGKEEPDFVETSCGQLE